MRNSHDMVNAEMPDFVDRCQALVDQKVAESLQKYQNLTREQIDLRKLDWKVGRGAYYRVGFVKPDGEMFQLYCFVDKATGEVLGGSWRGPSKTKAKRGSIFGKTADQMGVTGYGVKLLR